MIRLRDICYTRLGCADLDCMVDFGTQLLGLELYERGADFAFLRADDRTHNICYVAADPDSEVVGFEIGSEQELAEAEHVLRNAGVEVRVGSDQEMADRRVSAFIAFRDPSGTSVEFAVAPERTGRRYFPSRDAGVTEFGHFGLHACRPEESLRFWTEIVGARVSDSIGPSALLRIDEIHHKIALFPSQKVGVQHINFQVASLDDVMRSWYFLQRRNVPIVFGPGRHPTSTAIFLYFRGPDQRVYEYSHGVARITDQVGHVPRKFVNKPSSFCMWGARTNIEEFSE